MEILSKKLKKNNKIKKGFTLIEIIIATVIFLTIILIFIQVFSSIIKQNKVSIEKARMNEYLSLIEKTIKDELNASNLEVDPNTWRAFETSNAIVNPKFYPTCIIQPNIFQSSIDIYQHPLVYIYPNPNNQNNTLAALLISNRQIIARNVLINNSNNHLPLILINFVNQNNNREIRWYHVLNINNASIRSYSDQENNITNPTPHRQLQLSNWPQNQTSLLDLSNQIPQYERNSRYQISIVVSRLRTEPNDTNLNINGTYWRNTPNNSIFDPTKLIIYTSIWIQRNNNNSRILETKRSFLINLKYKKII